MSVPRALVAAAVLLAGLSTAEAGAASAACGPARVDGPAERSSASQDRARRAPVVRVTEAATAARPVSVTYEQPAGALYPQVEELLVFRTIQVVSRGATGRLWVRAEFPSRTVDVDLLASDAAGNRLATSTSANNEVADAAFAAAGFPPGGGPGFELLRALPARRCAAFTASTGSSAVPPGTTVKLSVWLGPAA